MSPRLGQVIEGIEAENYFLTQFLRDNTTRPNLNSIYWPITSSSKCKMACEKNSFTGEGVGLGGLGKGREWKGGGEIKNKEHILIKAGIQCWWCRCWSAIGEYNIVEPQVNRIYCWGWQWLQLLALWYRMRLILHTVINEDVIILYEDHDHNTCTANVSMIVCILAN